MHFYFISFVFFDLKNKQTFCALHSLHLPLQFWYSRLFVSPLCRTWWSTYLSRSSSMPWPSMRTSTQVCPSLSSLELWWVHWRSAQWPSGVWVSNPRLGRLCVQSSVATHQRPLASLLCVLASVVPRDQRLPQLFGSQSNILHSSQSNLDTLKDSSSPLVCVAPPPSTITCAHIENKAL